jgi:hypothetical protein
VLNKRSDGGGQNLTIMELLLGTFLVAAQSLRLGNDRRDRNLNPLLEKPVEILSRVVFEKSLSASCWTIVKPLSP